MNLQQALTLLAAKQRNQTQEAQRLDAATLSATKEALAQIGVRPADGWLVTRYEDATKSRYLWVAHAQLPVKVLVTAHPGANVLFVVDRETLAELKQLDDICDLIVEMGAKAA